MKVWGFKLGSRKKILGKRRYRKVLEGTAIDCLYKRYSRQSIWKYIFWKYIKDMKG